MSSEKKIKNLYAVFNPKSIAIIGASRNPTKIGHVVLKNHLDGGFGGKIYPINPEAEEILGLKCYPSVSAIGKKVDTAIISIPSKMVAAALEDCGKAGVRGAVVITGGFSEVGNAEGEAELVRIADKYGMALIGPNCMGVLNPASRVDSIFLPIYKLGRPHVGDISFISQSGAVGGCIVDLAARAGLGMAKFVSYGNAAVIDETDLLSYLEKDEKSGIIVMYVEAIRDGRRFMSVARRVTKKKPVVVLKAGITAQGAEAAKSHTGAIAGAAEAYKAAFKQCNMTEAESLDELFDFAKIFYQPRAHGRRIAIVTNGGGNGVLAADSVVKNNLELAQFSDSTTKELIGFLPPYATAKNPLDLVGDADAHRYESALNAVMKDPNVDAIVAILLFQTVQLDSSVVNIVVKASDLRQKPMVAVCTGGEYTELHRRILDSYGVPTYPSPSSAIRALAKFLEFSKKHPK
jgi:acetyltransferase